MPPYPRFHWAFYNTRPSINIAFCACFLPAELSYASPYLYTARRSGFSPTMSLVELKPARPIVRDIS